MQDMEFTIENGKLYMLQTRNGKRTAAAALKIACDLVDEGMIDEKEAVLHDRSRDSSTPCSIPQFDTDALKAATPIGRGLARFSRRRLRQDRLHRRRRRRAGHDRGEKVVLVRLETSPEDIEGMKAAQGILTVRGGMTSHAAVVARGMGTCCVSGCGEINMDEENKQFTLGGKTFHEGDYISIDGSTGNIYDEAHPHRGRRHRAANSAASWRWADKYRKLQVRTNADTPRDAKQARRVGRAGHRPVPHGAHVLRCLTASPLSAK